LFLVEGFTDIRFVCGLSEICDLTMTVPAREYDHSGLKRRVELAETRISVDEIPGGRVAFQCRSLWYLWRRAPDFNVVLSQEVLRGSINATLVGKLRGVSVVTYMGIDPIEYFRCRRARREIGPVTAFVGEALIKSMMAVNGRLADRCLAMGPYLRDVAARYSARAEIGLYYGVDTRYFRPVAAHEKYELRLRLGLPTNRFLVVLSSRISHEKDPETVLRALSLARKHGLDAVLLNLSGNYAEFLQIARKLQLPDVEEWVIARPAVHPMTELAAYFQTADTVALASLAEGAAFSTLEALSCGTPVVATAVGGMAVQLDGYARLCGRADPEAMAREILWVAEHLKEARVQAMHGRDYVVANWDRGKAFDDLRAILERVAH
jgi:glycosyltransferase involved in cell wall biosynthesis